MQEITTIARPYAEAVFETAKSESDFSSWSTTLELLSVIVSNEDMQAVMSNPRVDKAVLKEIVFHACGDKVASKTCRNFIEVLIDAGRLPQAGAIKRLFEQKRAAAEGTAKVEVISAYPLEDDQEAAIATSMEKRLGKKVDIESRVDESLIGGMVIRSGDSVIDASLSGRLASLNNEFLN